MDSYKLNLEIPKDYSYEQLVQEREQGGRFVFFTYLIPLPIFKPIKRISKIYYIKPNEQPIKFSSKYNLFTLLIGWWGLPFGPPYTLSTIRNNRTGTDITDDVFDNLTPQDFQSGQVTIKKITSIFVHPSKSNFKEIEKSFNKYSKSREELTEPAIIGYYIDTPNPYYIIGLNSHDIIHKDSILSELHKNFYSYIRFDFIDINDGTELSNKLKQQGKKITIANTKL